MLSNENADSGVKWSVLGVRWSVSMARSRASRNRGAGVISRRHGRRVACCAAGPESPNDIGSARLDCARDRSPGYPLGRAGASPPRKAHARPTRGYRRRGRDVLRRGGQRRGREGTVDTSCRLARRHACRRGLARAAGGHGVPMARGGHAVGHRTGRHRAGGRSHRNPRRRAPRLRPRQHRSGSVLVVSA